MGGGRGADRIPANPRPLADPSRPGQARNAERSAAPHSAWPRSTVRGADEPVREPGPRGWLAPPARPGGGRLPAGKVLVEDRADRGGGPRAVPAIAGRPAHQLVDDDVAFLLVPVCSSAFPSASLEVRPVHSRPPMYSASSRPAPSSLIAFAALRRAGIRASSSPRASGTGTAGVACREVTGDSGQRLQHWSPTQSRLAQRCQAHRRAAARGLPFAR